MKAFHDLFPAELTRQSPSNHAKLREVQRGYGSSLTTLSAALNMQEAIMKHMKRITTIQGETFKNEDIGPSITNAVVNNLLQYQPESEWIELAEALKGPAHVAKMLIRHCQERRSRPARPS